MTNSLKQIGVVEVWKKLTGIQFLLTKWAKADIINSQDNKLDTYNRVSVLAYRPYLTRAGTK